MNHQKKHKKLNRPKNSRTALVRSLLISFILNNKIKTTVTKAKVLRSAIERLITKAKKNDLATRRYLMKKLDNKKAVDKLLKTIAPKYKQRKGGYTRIIKLAHRQGDGAAIAQIELVQNNETRKEK